MYILKDESPPLRCSLPQGNTAVDALTCGHRSFLSQPLRFWPRALREIPHKRRLGRRQQSVEHRESANTHERDTRLNFTQSQSPNEPAKTQNLGHSGQHGRAHSTVSHFGHSPEGSEIRLCPSSPSADTPPRGAALADCRGVAVDLDWYIWV